MTLLTMLDEAIEHAKEVATENARLKERNEKLREQIETLVMYVESDGTRYWVDDDGNQHFDHSAVKDDAAELRELVWDMYTVMVEDAANCDVTYPEQFDDRMRELGVEVEK